MPIQSRLDDWKDRGALSPRQHAQLTGLAHDRPFSLFLEINILLYLGVLAFVAGLGWTVTTWSHQLGDILILALLSTLLAAAFGYSFYRAPAWSTQHTPPASPVLDYVLYLGCLVWCVELAYLEQRFHLLTGQWDTYLLLTAVLFDFLAYRFDNRFVLSLALSSLAGWLGLTIASWPFDQSATDQSATYRHYALLYCGIVGSIALITRVARIKPHFFGTYLNIVANILFCAVLSGVFLPRDYAIWLFSLLLAVAASLTWGITQRQFAFVAYAAVYGYIGISWLLVRNSSDSTSILLYFVTTAIAMLVLLVLIARNFGRAE